jgi:hypothetical protein
MSDDLGERTGTRTRASKGGPCGCELAEGNMTDALRSLDMSTGLRKVAERAKREPAARFHSLAHLIDEELLAGAFARLRSDAATSCPSGQLSVSIRRSRKKSCDASADYSSPPDLSTSSATNDKTIASGAKRRSINLIIISVG